MRGTGKGPAKAPEDYEDQFLHQTIGTSRIRSHSAKYGQHKVSRHQTFGSSSSSALPSTSVPVPGAAGTTASSVSSYLEHLPSLNLGVTQPPRPPRPPGGLLGISNGRGMGYGRSLGSSYDSPLTIHGSFNGHVRSGANLYGGRSQSSGISPAKPAAGHHRPSMSVFPIQKALEIAMKESRLLAAASSRGGSGSSGTGMSTGTTFVREVRRARHARGAILTEHGPTPDISLDEEDDGEDATLAALNAEWDQDQDQDQDQDVHFGAGGQNNDNAMDTFDFQTTTCFNNLTIGTMGEGFSDNRAHLDARGLLHRDITIQQPAVSTLDAKAAYPGIAYLPHMGAPPTGILSLRAPRSLRNVPSTPWGSSASESTYTSATATVALASTYTRPSPAQSLASSSSSIPFSHTSLDSLFISSANASAPYQSHFSPVLSSSSNFPSTRVLFSNASSSPSALNTSLSPSAVHAVRELLDSYPAPSPYCVDDKKRSPLHFAAASGDLELVEFLLERGVRPDCGRDIAGNMPLHLAIISNRIDVVAALLKAGADMTLASPMTHKTPLDLAESRLSYLLSRAQETVKQSQSSGASCSSGMLDLQNRQIATRSSFHATSTQSPALLYQIRGIVNLLRPYVVRQQKLQHGERHKERQKERSWERADKYMRQQHHRDAHTDGTGSGNGLWRVDPHSEDNFGDMEDEDEDDENDDDDHMDTGDRKRRSSAGGKRLSVVDMDGDFELDDEDELPPYSVKPKRMNRLLTRRMDADETEEALENLMNGLSLLEANRKQLEQQQLEQVQAQVQSHEHGSHHQEQQQQPLPQLQQQSHLQRSSMQDIGDGNLADSEQDPRSELEVEDALPDLLEQVQQVLQAIKLNEHHGS